MCVPSRMRGAQGLAKRDLVLRESGWVRTSTLADWRFGERSDIDEITREEARWFAESLGLGEFVK